MNRLRFSNLIAFFGFASLLVVISSPMAVAQEDFYFDGQYYRPRKAPVARPQHQQPPPQQYAQPNYNRQNSAPPPVQGPSYNQGGYNQNGYGTDGYGQSSYDSSSYDQSGYGQSGNDQSGYEADLAYYNPAQDQRDQYSHNQYQPAQYQQAQYQDQRSTMRQQSNALLQQELNASQGLSPPPRLNGSPQQRQASANGRQEYNPFALSQPFGTNQGQSAGMPGAMLPPSSIPPHAAPPNNAWPIGSAQNGGQQNPIQQYSPNAPQQVLRAYAGQRPEQSTQTQRSVPAQPVSAPFSRYQPGSRQDPFGEVDQNNNIQSSDPFGERPSADPNDPFIERPPANSGDPFGELPNGNPNGAQSPGTIAQPSTPPSTQSGAPRIQGQDPFGEREQPTQPNQDPFGQQPPANINPYADPPGIQPGAQPGTQPRVQPGTQPRIQPGTQPRVQPGVQPGAQQDQRPPQLPDGATDVPFIPPQDQVLPNPGTIDGSPRYPQNGGVVLPPDTDIPTQPEFPDPEFNSNQRNAYGQNFRGRRFGGWPDGEYREGARYQNQYDEYGNPCQGDYYGQQGAYPQQPLAPVQQAYPGVVSDGSGVYQQIVVAPECNACSAFVGDFEYESGFYLSLFGGYSGLETLRENVAMPGDDQRVFDFDYGEVYGAALGTYQGFNLRTELEFSYRRYQLDNVTSSLGSAVPANPGGDLGTYSGMVNAYWEFMGVNSPVVKPYIGAGIGFLFSEPDFVDGGQPISPADGDDSFVYQAMLGVNYKYRPNTDLFLEYRYHAVEGIRLDVTGIGIADFDLISNNIMVGVRFKF